MGNANKYYFHDEENETNIQEQQPAACLVLKITKQLYEPLPFKQVLTSTSNDYFSHQTVKQAVIEFSREMKKLNALECLNVHVEGLDNMPSKMILARIDATCYIKQAQVRVRPMHFSFGKICRYDDKEKLDRDYEYSMYLPVPFDLKIKVDSSSTWYLENDTIHVSAPILYLLYFYKQIGETHTFMDHLIQCSHSTTDIVILSQDLGLGNHQFTMQAANCFFVMDNVKYSNVYMNSGYLHGESTSMTHLFINVTTLHTLVMNNKIKYHDMIQVYGKMIPDVIHFVNEHAISPEECTIDFSVDAKIEQNSIQYNKVLRLGAYCTTSVFYLRGKTIYMPIPLIVHTTHILDRTKFRITFVHGPVLYFGTCNENPLAPCAWNKTVKETIDEFRFSVPKLVPLDTKLLQVTLNEQLQWVFSSQVNDKTVQIQLDYFYLRGTCSVQYGQQVVQVEPLQVFLTNANTLMNKLWPHKRFFTDTQVVFTP